MEQLLPYFVLSNSIYTVSCIYYHFSIFSFLSLSTDFLSHSHCYLSSVFMEQSFPYLLFPPLDRFCLSSLSFSYIYETFILSSPLSTCLPFTSKFEFLLLFWRLFILSLSLSHTDLIIFIVM
ncbi:hypothetical protein AMTRI_Chr02g214000 [Amborella trichopoda]